MGQEAMRAGEPDLAIAYYREGIAQKEPEPRNYLSIAAAYIAKGDEVEASLALAHFVEENPEHRNARFYYAELMRRLGKNRESQSQFERTIADLQQEPKCDFSQLAHCHGRLLELAESQEDEYQIHLQRGIGLYCLAQCNVPGAEEKTELSCEGLLCKAAGELSLAHALRPQEARPSWYLYSVWRRLAQDLQAQGYLREAQEAAPFSLLTPAELRSLQLIEIASLRSRLVN